MTTASLHAVNNDKKDGGGNMFTLGVVDPHTYNTTASSSGARGIGIVPAPREILKTIGSGFTPDDRQLSTVCNYLPNRHGWIVSDQETFWKGNLGDPHNVPYSHGIGLGAWTPREITQGRLAVLGEATTAEVVTAVPSSAATTNDLLAKLVAEDKKRTTYAMISAGAIVALTLLSLFRR